MILDQKPARRGSAHFRDTTLSRRTLLAAGLAPLVTSAGWAQALSGRPVIMGQVSLTFYAVTGAVVQALLERLGHSVMVKQGSHEEIFPMLGAGSIDLMAAAWLPEGHAAYWSRYGQRSREVVTLYDGARFFWGVPDYVPQSMVDSITDLANPVVAEKMAKRVQGIGSGAAISQFSQKAIVAYGLDAFGYAFEPGTQNQWIATCEAALRDRAWFIFPTWAPQFLNRDGRIRPISDPKGVLGSANRAVLVAPQERWLALPVRTRAALERLHLGIEAVTEMDWLVNVQAQDPRSAAALWIRSNQERFEFWVNG